MTHKGLLIGVDGTLRDEEYSDWKDICRLIGGGCHQFEAVPIEHYAAGALFVDAWGKDEQAYNHVASAFALRYCGIDPRDSVEGNVLVVGPPDSEARETDVLDAVVDKVRAVAVLASAKWSSGIRSSTR
jgi:hypothetical protein